MKSARITIFVCLVAWPSGSMATEKVSDQWTWLYKKAFADNECAKREQQAALHFCKEDVNAFTQLVFCGMLCGLNKDFFYLWAEPEMPKVSSGVHGIR